MTRRQLAVTLTVLGLVAIVWAVRLIGPDTGEDEVVTEVAVHVTQVRRATVHSFVTAYGRVEPEPAVRGRSAGGALITSLVDGVIAEIDAVEGQSVQRGAALFRLDSRMQEVAVEKARQQVEFAEGVVARQEQLLTTDGTSQRAYLEARQQLDAARSDLESSETDLAYRTITSPVSGTVVRIDARLGQRVDASAVLAEVVALDRLVVTAEVPTREIGAVAVGQSVLFGADDSSPGRVTVVGRNIDRGTGTYRVQAAIPPGVDLLPGQFVDIRVAVDEHPDVLVVPEGSVVTGADGDSWVVVVEGDHAVRTAVTLGLREGGLAEVAGAGLREGTAVVTDEAYGLPEETAVRVVDN